MPYTKRELIEASGLPNRTIRNYIARGLIPAAKGHGLAAEYSEEALVRARTIGRLRSQGMHIDAITQTIAGWTTARFKRFLAQSEPASDAAGSSEPVRLGAGRNEAAPDGRLVYPDVIADADLPEGPTYRIVPLLPGIGIMLDLDASPIVRRIAAEIASRYGRRAR